MSGKRALFVGAIRLSNRIIFPLLVLFDGDGTGDATIERDEGFCSGHSRDCLDFVVQKFHQVLVVLGVKFY